MKKLSKQCVAGILLVFLLVSACTPAAYAASNVPDTPGSGVITPFYEGVSTIQCSLSIAGTTASLRVSVDTKLRYRHETTVTLQRKVGPLYFKVNEWSLDGDGYDVLSKNETVSSGTYRVKAVIKVYDSGNSLVETITQYSSLESC